MELVYFHDSVKLNRRGCQHELSNIGTRSHNGTSNNPHEDNFRIAIVWQDDDGEMVIDLWRFYGMSKWTDNPEVEFVVIRENSVGPGPTCGDSLELLGMLMANRLKCSDPLSFCTDPDLTLPTGRLLAIDAA
jgi:hypothetical protein